ncbi:MAG: hypothetical protein Q7S76_00135 [bacterium]|nr:hypothetical protein [bacterium]
MTKTKRMSKTPTTELPLLWAKGFFKEWRSAGDIAAEFAKTGCHFGDSAVSKALSRAKYITRKGRGRGVSVKYIQAYPFEK